MALTDKTIVITRSAEANAELRSLLESRGARVICFPTIEITDPESWDVCDQAIWKLAEYQCVCFTSKNAVTKFVERIRTIRPQAVDTLGTRNIYAVGEKTKRSLECSGFSVIASPTHASAEELASLMQAHQLKDASILFPKSNIARDTLPQQLRSMGARVDEIVVYRTVAPEPQNLEQTRLLFLEKKIDAAIFFSPSSIINFSEMMGTEVFAQTAIAVIGSVTAETVEQMGLHVSIRAQQATAENLIESLEHYFA